MEKILLIPLLVSFFTALFLLPKWIKKCNEVGLLWEDMNKWDKPKNVASSGGVIIVTSFVLGVLSYVAIQTFIFNDNTTTLEILSLLSVILILAIIGLTDDLLGWKARGLPIRVRLPLAFLASIPLVVINAGTKLVTIPFLGQVELGIIYPLLIVPIGIAGATTTYNFLAGFNGLESGQGIIILTFISLVAYLIGSSWLSLIGLCMVVSLIVFYLFNCVPAKVFPGDILTYSVGALIAIMAILGDFERIAFFIFIPYIMEVILKLRGRLKKQSFGIPNEDGSLELPYEKIYGMTHLSLFILKKFKKKVYEKDVTYLIFIFQIIICLLSLAVFREALFG